MRRSFSVHQLNLLQLSSEFPHLFSQASLVAEAEARAAAEERRAAADEATEQVCTVRILHIKF